MPQTMVKPKAGSVIDSLKARLKKEKVRFIRLQFIDIMGSNKNVEIPDSVNLDYFCPDCITPEERQRRRG